MSSLALASLDGRPRRIFFIVFFERMKMVNGHCYLGVGLSTGVGMGCVQVRGIPTNGIEPADRAKGNYFASPQETEETAWTEII